MENTSNVVSPWLTAKEAAAYAKVNYRTLMEAARKGFIESTKTGTGKNSRLRFHQTWIDKWLESRSTGGEQ